MSSRKRAAAPRVHVTVNLDAAIVARVDALAATLSEPWRKVTRSDVLRILIEKGLSVVEKPGNARGSR